MHIWIIEQRSTKSDDWVPTIDRNQETILVFFAETTAKLIAKSYTNFHMHNGKKTITFRVEKYIRASEIGREFGWIEGR